jgi:hypothetical protein
LAAALDLVVAEVGASAVEERVKEAGCSTRAFQYRNKVQAREAVDWAATGWGAAADSAAAEAWAVKGEGGLVVVTRPGQSSMQL